MKKHVPLFVFILLIATFLSAQARIDFSTNEIVFSENKGWINATNSLELDVTGDILLDASNNIILQSLPTAGFLKTGASGTLSVGTTEADLEAQLTDVTNIYTNNDGSLDDDDVTLADVQTACSNDFHNIGGTDATDDTVSASELDGVFSTTGLLRRTGVATYDTITDNSANWNTAYNERGSVIAGNQLTWDGAELDVQEGSGSTLDADTLDSLDSTDFILAGTPPSGNIFNQDLNTTDAVQFFRLGIATTPDATAKLQYPANSRIETAGELITRQDADVGSGNVFSYNTTTDAEMTASSGSQTFFYIEPEIQQTGTAGYNALYIKCKETSTGSGSKRVLNFEVDDGVNPLPRFLVTNTGALQAKSETGTRYFIWDSSTAEATFDNGPTSVVLNASNGLEVTTNNYAFVAASYPLAGFLFSGSTHFTLTDTAGNAVFYQRITGDKDAWATGGIKIGTDQDANWFDDASHGTASTTMYIGDETIDTSVPSDERLKTNILHTKHGLDDILDMTVYDFDWKNRGGSGTGMIAQEMQKILPDIVEERSDGYLMIHYKEIIPILVRAIQEQQEKINELEERIEALELYLDI